MQIKFRKVSFREASFREWSDFQFFFFHEDNFYFVTQTDIGRGATTSLETKTRTIKRSNFHYKLSLPSQDEIKTRLTSIKLQRANGGLFKLKHYILLKTLVNIYHAIFSSHMRHACQVCGLCDNVTCHGILHKCALGVLKAF